MPDSVPSYPDLRPHTEEVALAQRLQFCREGVVLRIRDLDDSQARARPLPNTSMSVGAIVKHLAWVEDHYFVGKLLGAELPEPWASAPLADEPDWPFESSVRDSVADIISLYGAACARSDRAVGGRDLDALAAVDSFGKGPVNVRWLFVHTITETAWHLGHLDLLRDGLGIAPAPTWSEGSATHGK